MKLCEVPDRDPTDEELANELDLNPRCVWEYRQASKLRVKMEKRDRPANKEKIALAVAA